MNINDVTAWHTEPWDVVVIANKQEIGKRIVAVVAVLYGRFNILRSPILFSYNFNSEPQKSFPLSKAFQFILKGWG